MWAGHLARKDNNRWSKVITERHVRIGKRNVGQSTARCNDHILRKILGVTCLEEQGTELVGVKERILIHRAVSRHKLVKIMMMNLYNHQKSTNCSAK